MLATRVFALCGTILVHSDDSATFSEEEGDVMLQARNVKSKEESDSPHWEKLGHGFCRDNHGGKGRFETVPHAGNSRHDCQNACFKNLHKCTGYEWAKGHCEVHTGVVDHFEDKHGYECWKLHLRSRPPHTCGPHLSIYCLPPAKLVITTDHHGCYKEECHPPPRDYDKVGHGYCRDDHGGKGKFEVARHAGSSRHDCQHACDNHHDCTGYEYSHNHCEVHTGSVSRFQDKHGYECWKVVEHQCPHVIAIHCPHGHEVDHYGCKTGKCIQPDHHYEKVGHGWCRDNHGGKGHFSNVHHAAHSRHDCQAECDKNLHCTGYEWKPHDHCEVHTGVISHFEGKHGYECWRVVQCPHVPEIHCWHGHKLDHHGCKTGQCDYSWYYYGGGGGHWPHYYYYVH